MPYRVGVDIGGTFADFCVLEEATGKLSTLKVLTTPTTPGAEVIAGLEGVERRFGIAPWDIAWFTHGTTVGVNAVIQHKGIRLALFVTEKFRDVLEVARLKTPDPYHLYSRRPDPLVPRARVLEVRGRLLADGSEVEPLDPASVEAALARAEELGAEGIVLSLLHAWRNPAHEHAVKAMIQAKRRVFSSFEAANGARWTSRSSRPRTAKPCHSRAATALPDPRASRRHPSSPARPQRLGR